MAGAGDEGTQRANVTAFERWGLIPRMMVGATDRDLSVDLFGIRLPAPLFMAPVGVIGLCAQAGHGDLATARAAARTGVPMVASTLTVDPLEEVAAEFGDTPGFHRAEKGGYQGIVVTLDPRAARWPNIVDTNGSKRENAERGQVVTGAAGTALGWDGRGGTRGEGGPGQRVGGFQSVINRSTLDCLCIRSPSDGRRDAAEPV
ncbi:hypothetical protein BKA18_006071 [Streptomyces auratus]